MTVQTSSNVATGIGNGVTTVFPVGYKFNEESDLVVLRIDDATSAAETLTLNSDYTVQGAGNEAGGSVTMSAPLAVGKTLTITRIVDILQLTDLRNQGKFFAEVHEDSFDKFIMIMQQLFQAVGDSLQLNAARNRWDANGRRIINVGDPVDAQDAVTKSWLEAYITALLQTSVGPVQTAASVIIVAPNGDVFTLQDLANSTDPAKGAAIVAGAVQYIDDIDAISSSNAAEGRTLILTQRGKEGSFVIRSGVQPLADPQMGVYVPMGEGRYAERTLDGKKAKASWFYTGNWDDAVSNAYAFLRDTFGGGIIDVEGQDVSINRTHLFLCETLIDGGCATSGGGTIYIADEVDAFIFGQITPDRHVLAGGGIINCRVRGADYVRGNISDIYGSTNEAFGFRTLNTAEAGAKRTDNTANITSRLAVFQAVDSPIQCHGNNVEGVGTAFVADRQYGYDIRNNLIRWCTIGVHVAGLATTVTLSKNTIERCAIGAMTGYPSSFINIEDNVIEANYGGCDVFCFNGPDTLRINRNYFEASPQNIVFRSDSSGDFVPFQVHIEENTGINLYCGYPNIRDIVLERNWINRIELFCNAGGSLKNIILRDNYNGPGVNAYDVNDIVLNSVAQQYVHEIVCSNAAVAPQQASAEGLVSSKLAKNQRPFVKWAAGSSASVNVEVPNTTINAVFRVTVVKYRAAMDWGNRVAIFILAVRRQPNGDAVVDAVEVSQHSLNVGATDILAIPMPTPVVAGSSMGVQVVTLTVGSAAPGGSTAHHMIEAEYLSSVSGIVVR